MPERSWHTINNNNVKTAKKKTARKTKFQLHMAEIAKKGGKKVLKKYGREHFAALARKRWEDKRD